MPQNATPILNPALREEVDAINAIYGTDIVASVADTTNSNNSKDRTDHLVLQIPEQPISFLLSFRHDYPETRPQVDGTHSTGTLGKGEGHHAVKLIQDTLEQAWIPGSVCLFDLIEEVGPRLTSLQQDGARESSNQTITMAEESEARPEELDQEGAGLTNSRTGTTPGKDTAPIPNWTLSDPLTEKKSIFIARCASVADASEATSFLANLLSTNKKVASATHNITAWRILNPETAVTVQDCDDDGETAAGGRLLHVMQLMDVWNVVMVVTRWYGGVKLGPDRFRLINQVAREALVRGGFFRGDGEKGVKRRGKR